MFHEKFSQDRLLGIITQSYSKGRSSKRVRILSIKAFSNDRPVTADYGREAADPMMDGAFSGSFDEH
jgi:hypothetical protein